MQKNHECQDPQRKKITLITTVYILVVLQDSLSDSLLFFIFNLPIQSTSSIYFQYKTSISNLFSVFSPYTYETISQLIFHAKPLFVFPAATKDVPVSIGISKSFQCLSSAFEPFHYSLHQILISFLIILYQFIFKFLLFQLLPFHFQILSSSLLLFPFVRSM